MMDWPGVSVWQRPHFQTWGQAIVSRLLVWGFAVGFGLIVLSALLLWVMPWVYAEWRDLLTAMERS